MVNQGETYQPGKGGGAGSPSPWFGTRDEEEGTQLTQPDKDPNHLKEPFRSKFLAAVAEANRECAVHIPDFSEWVIIETLRSPERQAELYAKGRTTPGPVVTWRKHSIHEDGNAADVAWKDGQGVLHWDTDRAYQILGHCARAEGLTWGGDWTQTDNNHIQLG